MSKKTIITLVLVGTLALGGIFAAYSYQSVYAASDVASAARYGGPTGFGLGGNIDELAAELGKTAADIQAAEKAAAAKAVDLAVTEGYITAAQATAVKAFPNVGLGVLARYLTQEQITALDYQALVAAELGITKEQLTAAVAATQQTALQAAVANGQMTQAQADQIQAMQALRTSTTFRANLRTALETALKAEVDAGTLTQAQVDALLARFDANDSGMFGFGMGGPADKGFGGRMGGMHSGMMGNPQGMMGPQGTFGNPQGMMGGRGGMRGSAGTGGGMYGQGGMWGQSATATPPSN